MVRIRIPRAALSIFSAGLIVVGGGWSCSSNPDHPSHRPTVTRTAYADTPAGIPITTTTIADVVQRVSPAVVTVVTTQILELPEEFSLSPLDELFRHFFEDQSGGPSRSRPPLGRIQTLGSGFIVDKAGKIVTNNHVVESAADITVQLSDNRKFAAKLIGRDEKTDLALIQIDAKGDLPTVSWGNSDPVRVGEWIVALGNPFGLGQTATAGIVSAHHREIGQGPYDDFLQLDAPINRGNSGGPTVNLKGEVIGVNAVIVSPSGGSVGIGFAIPSNLARSIIEKLEQTGRIERGWLGVQIQDVTPEIAESLGLAQARGALVTTVDRSGPASEAGLVPGDVILALDGREVKSSRDLPRMVAELKPGTRSRIVTWHEGAQKDIPVTVGRSSEPVKPTPAVRIDKSVDGMTLAEVDTRTRARLGLVDGGAQIIGIDPKGAATAVGLRVGEVIVAIGRVAVASPEDVSAQISAARKAGARSVLLRIVNEQAARFVALPIDQE